MKEIYYFWLTKLRFRKFTDASLLQAILNKPSINKQFIIKFNDGKIKKAFPLAHNFPADLALLTLNKELEVPNELFFSNKIKGLINVVAFDQGRNSNRIYNKGKIISFSDIQKYPQGRIHTTAKSLPGNSGGVAVDEDGNFVGIRPSGSGFRWFYNWKK